MHYFSQILFWNETLHVSDNSFVHRQEFLTIHTAMAYVIQVCRQLILLLESCLQTWMTYTIAECTVNNSWWWTEELSETCRVSFQNKFQKLVHLVGFIIRKFVTMHGHMNVKFTHNKYGWGKKYARERRGRRGKTISVHLLKWRDTFEDLGIGGRIKLE
jgi:hypothetical protein